MTTTPSRDEMLARLAELRAANEAATSWGAAVGARSEEIRDLERRLAVSGADLPATSEFMGVTAGETAPNSSAVAETDANAPDDARLVSGATLNPTSQPPESGER